MLCERCKIRPAEIHLVNVRDGERSVQHLCRECARERMDLDDVASLMKMSFSIEGLTGIEEAFKDLILPALRGIHADKRKKNRICPHCGGILPDSMFEHGAEESGGEEARVENSGTGRMMTAQEELAALSRKMGEAAAAEDYETAAKLRDRIAELKAIEEKGKENGL